MQIGSISHSPSFSSGDSFQPFPINFEGHTIDLDQMTKELSIDGHSSGQSNSYSSTSYYVLGKDGSMYPIIREGNQGYVSPRPISDKGAPYPSSLCNENFFFAGQWIHIGADGIGIFNSQEHTLQPFSADQMREGYSITDPNTGKTMTITSVDDHGLGDTLVTLS